MTRTIPAALAAAAALALALPAAANHVDFLGDDGTSFSLSSSGAAVSGTQTGSSGSLLGGTRVVTVEQDEGFAGSISATKTATGDVITVMNGDVAAGNLVLDYPGISNSDFDTLWDRIDVQIPALFMSSGIGDAEFDAFLTVESSAGTGTASSGRIEASVTGGSTVLSFQFDDPAFAAVDFTDVDGVTLLFDTAILGSDFSVGAITRESNAPVPEPTSLAVLGLGGLAALRRRRRA